MWHISITSAFQHSVPEILCSPSTEASYVLGNLGMDGEKEKERERGDEKECDETEEDAEGATLLWQETYPDDDLGLPIMHWEDLGLRIAELEKQQEERRQREKV